jgi:hypothetical protein
LARRDVSWQDQPRERAVDEMSDELLSFEEGDRVAVMRLAPLTGDIQIVEATVVGMIDEYQAVIKFAGGDKEIAWPVGDLTRMPSREAPG